MARKKESPSRRRKVAGRHVPADRGASVKSAARRVANFNVPASAADSGTGGSDPPIIVSGGNSVHVDMSDKFADDGSGGGHKKYKHSTGTLAQIVIDGGTPINLNSTSVIEIRYN